MANQTKFIFNIISVILLLFSDTILAATPAEWKKGAYSYNADNTKLSMLLEHFAQSHGVKAKFQNIPETLVSTVIRSSSAEAFMQRIALEYSLQWFVYNDTLYVSSLESQASKRFSDVKGRIPSLKQALIGVKLFEPRFGWGELKKTEELLVTGPQEYINLISNFVTSQKKHPTKSKKTIMYFPLKYADSEDRVINYRDQKIVVSGVSSLLKELLNKNGGRGGTKASKSEPMNELLDDETSNLADYITGDVAEIYGKLAGDISVQISSDARTNSILISGDSNHKEEYQNLISKLDVPQKLIDIQALIVDIDHQELREMESKWKAFFKNDVLQLGASFGGRSMFLGNHSQLLAHIKSLETKGAATLIASPSVVTLENHPAIVDFQDVGFIHSISENSSTSSPLTAGTTLRVTPRSVEKNDEFTIQLILDISDGSLKHGSSDQLKGMDDSVISTQAIVYEGSSLVLGGIGKNETKLQKSKVPLLGDLPIVGSLFSSNSKNRSQRERLFIITPRILGDQLDPQKYLSNHLSSSSNYSVYEFAMKEKMKNKIENIFSDLSKNKIPLTMVPGGDALSLRTLCKIPKPLLDRGQKQQWYSSREFQVTVGTVTNETSSSKSLNSLQCSHERVLATAIWPKSTLNSGESAEIFVVYTSDEADTRSRKSLLK